MYVIGTTLFRTAAVLLLLVAGAAAAYPCDMSDACVSHGTNNCDQPLGHNCICCCHHVVPVAIFVLRSSGTGRIAVAKKGLELAEAELAERSRQLAYDIQIRYIDVAANQRKVLIVLKSRVQ